LIGANPGEGIAGFWKGLLDELRIYDRALTPGEIEILALAPADDVDGDYNDDGTVDAADYVVWRKNPGGIYTPDDYNTWRAHFGETIGSGAGAGFANSNVPEPTGWLMLLFGIATMFCRRCGDVS
jgi:hypothetical protein